jgi:hypothetical protein
MQRTTRARPLSTQHPAHQTTVTQVSEGVSSYLAAIQHILGRSVPDEKVIESLKLIGERRIIQ